MSELRVIRQLKVEESRILEILDLLRKQYSALKVEELDLKSRIRDKNIVVKTEEIVQETVLPSTSREDGGDVNETKLDLTVDANRILNRLASGGRSANNEGEEESEMESEDENPLINFLDK